MVPALAHALAAQCGDGRLLIAEGADSAIGPTNALQVVAGLVFVVVDGV